MMNQTPIPIRAVLILLAALSCWQAFARDNQTPELSKRSAEELLKQSREAYTIFERNELSMALAAKGIETLPQLKEALGNPHWHVRHCALMTLRELVKTEGNRAAIQPLLPKFSELLLQDPALGVRWVSAECIGGLGAHGKDAQEALAKSALNDKETWVRNAASSALTAVGANTPIMIPLYESMIRSDNKDARKDGISKAGDLFNKGFDIKTLEPALMDLFRKPKYDANFSGFTRVPAMALLLKMNADTAQLVPFIIEDLRTAWKITPDGYHPYQKTTLSMFGSMGANAAAAIPVLEEVIADPTKFGCARNHPDYGAFIALSKQSIQQIRAAMEKKGARQ